MNAKNGKKNAQHKTPGKVPESMCEPAAGYLQMAANAL